MTRCIHDRVKETSTTTGTGNITLAGAVAQFKSFSSRFEIGLPFYYAIVAQTGTEWEVGWGYLLNATTLSRLRVDESSNSDLKVNFSAGTKDIFNTASAYMLEAVWTKGAAVSMATGMALP